MRWRGREGEEAKKGREGEETKKGREGEEAKKGRFCIVWNLRRKNLVTLYINVNPLSKRI